MDREDAVIEAGENPSTLGLSDAALDEDNW
jgi:hypothetical protein